MGWGVLYHAFKKFAARRPKAMKKPLFPVIASVAHVPSAAWCR